MLSRDIDRLLLFFFFFGYACLHATAGAVQCYRGSAEFPRGLGLSHLKYYSGRTTFGFAIHGNVQGVSSNTALIDGFPFAATL